MAQILSYEQEPNNKPTQANAIKANTTLLGSMQNNDQDAFLWDVKDTDVDYTWTVSLDGIPGNLTKVDFMQLDFTEDGKSVTKVHKIDTLSNRNGSKTVSQSGLSFAPGPYYFGLSYAGKDTQANGYRLKIHKDKRLYYLKLKNNSQQNPEWLRNNSLKGLYFQNPSVWLTLKINAKEAQQIWKIAGHVAIGQTLKITLHNTQDQVMSTTQSGSFGAYALKDLKLPEGQYLLELQSQKNTIANIEMVTSGVYVKGHEAEPNNSIKTANKFDISQPISARIGNQNDVDFFSFTVSEELAQQRLQIKLNNPSKVIIELCLYQKKTKLQCKRDKKDITLNTLVLAQGDYTLGISRAVLDTSYTIEINQQGAHQPLLESEPNDDYKHPVSVNAKGILKGEFQGKDEDFIKFEVTDAHQYWSIQANGTNITSLALLSSGGKVQQEIRVPKNAKRVRLSQLKLMPGTHLLRISGTNGKYLLRTFTSGIIDENFETEPNDTVSKALALRWNQKRTGLLQNLNDKDYYHYNLTNQQDIDLTIKPPLDGSIHYQLFWDGQIIAEKTSKIGQALKFKAKLQVGSYTLLLKANKKVSDDTYQVDLKQADFSDCKTDCEPNDTAHQANSVQLGQHIAGVNNTHRDNDWYVLAAFDTETTVTFENHNKITPNIKAFLDYDQIIRQQNTPDQTVSYLIPAHKKFYFTLGSLDVPYDVTLNGNHKPKEQAPTYEGLTIKLTDIPKALQSYSPYAQVFTGLIQISNTGNKAQNFDVETEINDYRWQAKLNQSQISLQAGESKQVPIEIHASNDLWKDQIKRISVVLKNNNKIMAKTWQDISTTADAPLLSPENYWAIDPQLLGGINVAASFFGAQRTPKDKAFNVNAVGTNFDALFNGFTTIKSGMIYRGNRTTKEDYITIDLAGNKPVEVYGTILNPTSSVSATQFPKDFDFQLSIDGIHFKSAITGTLKPVHAEQSFVLPKSTTAQFARLYLLNDYSDQKRGITGLGEWKVIAKPSTNLSTVTTSHGFNIAEPKWGGHVIWSSNQSSGNWDINMLTEKQEKASARSKNNKDWQWVVGFKNERAAKITHIQWQQPQLKLSKNSHLFKKVKVLVATDFNTGPWQLIATQDVSTEAGSVTQIPLKKPTWARYVKFSVGSIKNRDYAYFPETIKIYEQNPDENYQSILGEWGEHSQQGIYEKLNPPHFIQNFDDKNNNTHNTAIDLSQKKTAQGQVQLEQADKPDWYKYTIPLGHNTLNIQLSGRQSIETIIHVENAQGQTQPLIVADKSANQINYQIPVIENQDYSIKVEEPQRSVIFTWDTSGSTQSYHSIIYDAINRYSNAVIPERDNVNFIPFGGNTLMDKWYGKPFFLQSILNEYPRNLNSSSAENALYNSAKALQNRQGKKAIIVITDAITPKDAKMWDAFRTVKPHVYAIGIINANNPTNQLHLMQSWSRSNSGDFHRVYDAADVNQAFERAATQLRQPAHYQLTLNSEFIKAPGPGKLLITQSSNNQDTAVELILDASGSMLKHLNGKRRINIAKAVLINAITKTIPQGTPLALRVFGNKQANACRTDLAIKLSPLKPKSAASIIDKIQAKNLAKTPIADSLTKVKSDLNAHKGKKIIILVTDGEETCEGNPQQVIDQLIDAGLDIRLNIIGFEINDESLKQQFQQWSNQGGGSYFDSDNTQSLNNAITQALKTPYSVYSQSGELLKQGNVNGDPIELPAGLYNIKVHNNKVTSYDNYQIGGENTQTIVIKN